MITLTTEQAQQIEEVLEELCGSIDFYNKYGPDWTHKDGTESFNVSVLLDRADDISKAISALREALEQPPCPNGCDTSKGRCADCPDPVIEQPDDLDWITPEAVFAAKLKLHGIDNPAEQPVKEVELTNDEIRELFNGYVAPETLLMFRAVIAAHKDKNRG